MLQLSGGGCCKKKKKKQMKTAVNAFHIRSVCKCPRHAVKNNLGQHCASYKTHLNAFFFFFVATVVISMPSRYKSESWGEATKMHLFICLNLSACVYWEDASSVCRLSSTRTCICDAVIQLQRITFADQRSGEGQFRQSELVFHHRDCDVSNINWYNYSLT